MGENTRLHDAIVGGLVLVGVLLGYYVSALWLWLPGLVAALMLQSSVTGWCPVYATLAKLRHINDDKHHGFGTPLHH